MAMVEIQPKHTHYAELVKGRASRMAGRAMGWDIVNDMPLEDVARRTAEMEPKSARHALALWFEVQKDLWKTRALDRHRRMLSLFKIGAMGGWDKIEDFLNDEFTKFHTLEEMPDNEGVFWIVDSREDDALPVAELKRLTPKTIEVRTLANGRIRRHNVKEETHA